MVRTAGWIGGLLRPAMRPARMYPHSGIEASATVRSATVLTAVVRISTGRMPQTPIQRLVSGPDSACPALVAASTRPAAP